MLHKAIGKHPINLFLRVQYDFDSSVHYVRSLCHLGEVTTASGCPYGRSRQTGSSESAPPPLNLQLHLPRPRSYATCKSFHRISFHPLGKLDGLSLLRHHYFHVFFPWVTIQSKQVGCRRSLIFIYMHQSQTHGTGQAQGHMVLSFWPHLQENLKLMLVLRRRL